jgi:hypothetical protein
MKSLTRADLTDDQYHVLRDAPHFVALAVSSAAGSFIDEMYERVAATSAIADGEKSDHPIVREIAGTDDVKAAQRAVRVRILARDPGHRSASDLEKLAVEAVAHAVGTLKEIGAPHDYAAYRAFVLSVARGVASAAREGDLLGVGGQAVSEVERSVLAAVEEALAALV